MLSESYNPFFILKVILKKIYQSDRITSLLETLRPLPVAIKTNAKFLPVVEKFL